MPFSALATAAAAIVVITALYFARDIFIPLTLAILLSFALAPLAMLLRRWHFGRVPSVIAAVLFACLVIAGVGSAIGGQLAQLAANLPQYQSNIIDKIQSVRSSTTGSGFVGRAAEMLKDLSSEITKTAPPPGSKAPSAPTMAPSGAQPQPPISVEIHQPESTALQVIQTIIGPLLQPLATAGIVIVFVAFFLLQREDLRDRFIRLAGATFSGPPTR